MTAILIAIAVIWVLIGVYVIDKAANPDYDHSAWPKIGVAVWLVLTLVATFIGTAPAAEQRQVRVYEGTHASADEFVRSIRMGMADLTDRRGIELCGAIEQDGNRYRIVVVTSEKYKECNYLRPKGAIGLHTHPDRSGNRTFSEADLRTGPGYLIVGRRILFHDGKGTIKAL